MISYTATASMTLEQVQKMIENEYASRLPSLRDQFAMATLTGMLASCHFQDDDWPIAARCAQYSYAMADAMLRQREVE
jgi:hypothetical protein